MNTAPAIATVKILVIDDNPIIQRTVYFALRDCGHKVFTAGDTTGALNIVRSERPNLILLDINFPMDDALIGGERDGFWALTWMRRMEECKGVPIVIISSDDPAVAGPRAMAAGAAAYLHKPVSKENLVQTVTELLKPHA